MMIQKGVCGNKLSKRKEQEKLVVVGFSGIQICLDSVDIPGLDMKENPLTRDHLKFCRALQNAKIVPEVLISKYSVSKVMKMVAEHCSGAKLAVGSDLEIDIRRWLLLARHCGNRSSASAVFLAVQKGKKVGFKRRSIWRPRGFKLELKPQVYFCDNTTSFRDEKASVPKKAKPDTYENVSIDDKGILKEVNFRASSDCRQEQFVRSISVIRRELPESNLGWPLLKTNPMSLPRPSNVTCQKNLIDVRDSSSGQVGNSVVEKVELEGNNHLNDESCSLVDEASPSSASTISEELPQSAQSSPLLSVARLRTFDSMEESDSNCKYESSSSFVSTLFEELPQYAQGWPLLLLAPSRTVGSTKENRSLQDSAGQRVEDQLNRSEDSEPITQPSSGDLPSDIPEDSTERNISCPWIRTNEKYSTQPRKLPNTLELLLGRRSSTCRWFSYKELRRATSKFSSANLIGEGGCSNVYKGVLPNGKIVAVKMLKPYKEAWNDFCLEISILSSLNHKHITPLIGVCIEDDYLVSAYEFFHKGSLEESLHGEKSVLTWDARFNVAIKVAEALNYLHSECPRPVIHRDVKSSNILLSNKFQPQLSDFGLAIWGPTDSTYLVDNDVAGTFGYIAPEYFMHGRVSDKIDVYSYGVVLLELISGRRPIASKSPNGQESLVKWAKPLLETRDLKALVDSKLDGDFDVAQVQRLVMAANLCINHSARLRPKMNQILRLLRGEGDAIAINVDLKGLSNRDDNDDEDLISESDFQPQPHLSVALLDSDNDGDSLTGTARTSSPKKRSRTLKDLLKEPH